LSDHLAPPDSPPALTFGPDLEGENSDNFPGESVLFWACQGESCSLT